MIRAGDLRFMIEIHRNRRNHSTTINMFGRYFLLGVFIFFIFDENVSVNATSSYLFPFGVYHQMSG